MLPLDKLEFQRECLTQLLNLHVAFVPLLIRRKRPNMCAALRSLLVIITCAFTVGTNGQTAPFEDREEARRDYSRMIEAFHRADTLSYVCRFEREALGVARTSCTYRVWLKKPSRFRVEVKSDNGDAGGVLIGDGANLWIHWPNGRPRFEPMPESVNRDATRMTSYMKKAYAHGNKISIAHEVSLLGYGMGFPIMDASIFHGYDDPLYENIDAVRRTGIEAFDDHLCRKIEISLLDHQRSQYLWLSNQDNLPRRLVELVRLDHDVFTKEVWSSVKVDKEIPDSLFQWQPPQGWTEWKLPADQDYWPKVGSQASEFEMESVDGDRIRLSDYRGKVIWLNFWRLGCPPCVAELPYLQQMYTDYKSDGLVILGVNVSDDRKQLKKLLDTIGVSYPNVLDTTAAAKKVYDSDYGVGAIPLNCVIGRDGVIVDVWLERSDQRANEALRKAGIAVQPSDEG